LRSSIKILDWAQRAEPDDQLSGSALAKGNTIVTTRRGHFTMKAEHTIEQMVDMKTRSAQFCFFQARRWRHHQSCETRSSSLI